MAHGPPSASARLTSHDAPDSDLDIAVVFRAGTPEAALDAVRTALRPTEDAERVAVSVIGLWPEDVVRLAEKDAADYGARHRNLAPARALLADLPRLAQWVEQVLPTV